MGIADDVALNERATTAQSMRRTLGNRLLVLTTLASLGAHVAEWALFAGAIVYAFDKGGTTAAGIGSIALCVPAVIVAPFAGRAAAHQQPQRIQLAVYATLTVAYGGAAGAAFASASTWLVVGLSALGVAAMTFLRPSRAVLMPAVARTSAELAVANVWFGYCESAGVLVGPLFATAMLAAQGPPLVLAGCAALTLSSSILASGRFADMGTGAHDDEPALAVTYMLRSVAALRSQPGATGVLAVAASQFLLVGALDLIFVVLANDVLDIGGEGAGLLATCFGAGAVLSMAASTSLVRRPRLAPLLFIALVALMLVTAALGLHPSLALAIIALTVIGFGRSLLDVTSRMLLQRAAPADSMAAAFAAIELLGGIGMTVGAIGVQVVIAVSGVRVALVALGGFFAIVLASTFGALRVADDHSDVPIVAISLLRRVAMFAPLHPMALEALARGAVERRVRVGEVIVSEGDVGDSFYAVADGAFDVVMGGVFIRRAERGDGFGEVALLADIERTATVTAATEGVLLEVDREPFLLAVTGSEASYQSAWNRVRSMELDIAIPDTK